MLAIRREVIIVGLAEDDAVDDTEGDINLGGSFHASNSKL